MKCRHCQTPLTRTFADLGSAPPSNAYLAPAALKAPERWYPLHVMVCDKCFLVQTEDFAAFDQLFDENYAYFSSYSKSWLDHAERYVGDMVQRFVLGPGSVVAEIAANDGYLLQFVKARGIDCYGVEPTASTAAAARDIGIDIVEAFFGRALGDRLSAEGRSADLIAANNVLAHVPDINDFVSGFSALLKSDGVATFEFPHLAELIRHNQFDTIYHEHFSYLSLGTVERIFRLNGLAVFDVEKLATHGGSLRVFAQRADSGSHDETGAVASLKSEEQAMKLDQVEGYRGFQKRTEKAKDDFLRFLINQHSEGRPVAAYGAAAKGNTFLNYAGVRGDLISFVVDRNPEKQGKFMPGSRIPIVEEARLKQDRPEFIVILPWNLADEISDQLSYARDWGAKFVRAIPEVKVW
ncbi:MAG: methyltransferase domain-containing protein [Rhizobiaceae bacterium]